MSIVRLGDLMVSDSVEWVVAHIKCRPLKRLRLIALLRLQHLHYNVNDVVRDLPSNYLRQVNVYRNSQREARTQYERERILAEWIAIKAIIILAGNPSVQTYIRRD